MEDRGRLAPVPSDLGSWSSSSAHLPNSISRGALWLTLTLGYLLSSPLEPWLPAKQDGLDLESQDCPLLSFTCPHPGVSLDITES